MKNTDYTRDFPKPEMPLKTFYVAPTEVYKKGECLIVNINGYKYPITVGARNTAPGEVYEWLKNAKSRCRVPDETKSDQSMGGVPRPMHEFATPPLKDLEYIGDYDIELLEEHKQ